MKKYVIGILCSALLLCLLPATALAYDYGGLTYNDTDFNKIQAFLEGESGGVKNGELLYPGTYDKDDPATWTGVTWNAAAEKRVTNINFNSGDTIAGSLDLSGLTTLVSLTCYENQLTSLNVSGCTALTTLACYYNQLASLNVSGCAALQDLFCHTNQLTSLDVSGCTALQQIRCYSNQLTSLDISGLANLTDVLAYQNNLTSVSGSGCTSLMELSLNSNQLSSLDVSVYPNLTALMCESNSLMSLNVSGNPNLQYLGCAHNQLTSLDVFNHGDLNTLSCFDNSIGTLNIGGCLSLRFIDCSENGLTSLDLSGNPLIVSLDCSDNALTSLDLTDNGNVLLQLLDIKGNPLGFVKANIGGGRVDITANGDGYVYLVLDVSMSEFYAEATPREDIGTVTFHNWIDEADTEVSTNSTYDLTVGDDYDLTANFLILTGNPADGIIYTGGRITITPSIPGGTWQFDSEYFSRDGNTFTGLKGGESMRITYRLGATSMFFTVTVRESGLPQTGQDLTWVWVLAGLAALALTGAGWMMLRKGAKRT